MEPGRGERRPARRRATCSWPSNLKRWKNERAKMAERWPFSGLSDVSWPRAGAAAVDEAEEVGRTGTGERKVVSRMSPSKKETGNVSGVVRKSSWPISQRSAEVCISSG